MAQLPWTNQINTSITRFLPLNKKWFQEKEKGRKDDCQPATFTDAAKTTAAVNMGTLACLKQKQIKKEMVKHHIRGSCLQDNLDRIKDFHHEGYAEAIRGDRGGILRGEHLSVPNAMPTGNEAACSCLCCLHQAVRNPVSCHSSPRVGLGPWLRAGCSLGYARKSSSSLPSYLFQRV